jgi:hypothetical protein
VVALPQNSCQRFRQAGVAEMAGSDWSDGENDLIVADYFEMLRLELAGISFNKAERNRNLQSVLNVRSRGSIEFKHQNISAVMRDLGQDRILGYAELYNYQMPLVNAVIRQLENSDSSVFLPKRHTGFDGESRLLVHEESMLRYDYPPTLRNEPPQANSEIRAAVARKFDVAARDAANRHLGKAGEELILSNEISILTSSGRRDLAQRIRWTSQEDGDGAGYDISSFEPDGRDRLIEVKTTNGWERTPFHISRNELAVADERRDHWCLVRLWNFAREPKAFEIRPPLDAHVTLTPTSFLASIQ